MGATTTTPSPSPVQETQEDEHLEGAYVLAMERLDAGAEMLNSRDRVLHCVGDNADRVRACCVVQEELLQLHRRLGMTPLRVSC